MTISLHESGRYLFPGTGFVQELGSGPGEGTSVNLPLAPYTEDEVYWYAFSSIVPPQSQSSPGLLQENMSP